MFFLIMFGKVGSFSGQEETYDETNAKRIFWQNIIRNSGLNEPIRNDLGLAYFFFFFFSRFCQCKKFFFF